MFNILLLWRWYNLSEPGVKQAQLDRISFIRFTECAIEDDVPDETTIYRFCNGLFKLNIFEKLFDMLNRQLETKGRLVREGAVVDASVVESQRRPRKVVDVMPDDRAEDGFAEPKGSPECKVSYSDDGEAAWLRKG